MHLIFTVGWIGSALAYLALGVTATTSQDSVTIRGAWVAMEVTGWFVIVPMAVGSLLTGLGMALGTRWGLVRYYWVLFALVLTTLATVVLILHMPDDPLRMAQARTSSGASRPSAAPAPRRSGRRISVA